MRPTTQINWNQFTSRKFIFICNKTIRYPLCLVCIQIHTHNFYHSHPPKNNNKCSSSCAACDYTINIHICTKSSKWRERKNMQDITFDSFWRKFWLILCWVAAATSRHLWRPPHCHLRAPSTHILHWRLFFYALETWCALLLLFFYRIFEKISIVFLLSFYYLSLLGNRKQKVIPLLYMIQHVSNGIETKLDNVHR